LNITVRALQAYPERSEKSGAGRYRYGFNGKENDNEVKGVGDQIDYGFRMYDPRVCRFLSVDPLTKKYPELTPYQYGSNRPIDGIDMNGLEYLSFNRSMYRMQFGTRSEDIKLGNGSMQTITSSYTVVNIIYQNIPTSLQDAKTKSFKSVDAGPVTTLGRDYTVDELSNILYDRDKYFKKSPSFNGKAEDGESTSGINSIKTVTMPNGIQNPNSMGSALSKNGPRGIVQNIAHTGDWTDSRKEYELRKGFYSATNLVDAYLSKNPSTGTNYFGDVLSGGSDRAMLINFVTDGYLPKPGDMPAENTTSLRQVYSKQLAIAWNGLQIMQAQGVGISSETKSAVTESLQEYKKNGGGNDYDKINQYMTTTKQ
jgi:RHS repeat-associated protein